MSSNLLFFYSVGSNPHCIVASDFNNDGIADLTNANLYSNSVSVLLGNRDGTFNNQVSYGTGSGPDQVGAIDLNKDGKPRLSVFNYYSGTISVRLGNGDGTFQNPNSYYSGTGGSPDTAIDFNEDGYIDLDNDGDGIISVLLGNCDESLYCNIMQARVRYKLRMPILTVMENFSISDCL
ncbi:MAG: VCBS repeat-containing protein [Candidatus Midichloria sp.]|nr:VCBS repeat-containing protein [Candidatus Midichloria sp.]